MSEVEALVAKVDELQRDLIHVRADRTTAEERWDEWEKRATLLRAQRENLRAQLTEAVALVRRYHNAISGLTIDKDADDFLARHAEANAEDQP